MVGKLTTKGRDQGQRVLDAVGKLQEQGVEGDVPALIRWCAEEFDVDPHIPLRMYEEDLDDDDWVCESGVYLVTDRGLVQAL